MFTSPSFIQNRNIYRAIAPIRRGFGVKLSGVGVEECSGADDAVIGISLCDCVIGDAVEIVWIGYADVAMSGAAVGDEIRLGSSGEPVVGGDGRMIGIAAGATVGAYTIVRIGLLGYKPAAGSGGGSPLVPMNLREVEVTDPYGEITLPASDLSESQYIMATGDYQVTRIEFTGTMDMSAPIGTQIITNFFVGGEDLAPEIELSVDDPMTLFGNRYATSGDGVAAWTLTATRVNLAMGGDILDGWIVFADPLYQAVPAPAVTYDPDEYNDWADPKPNSVQEALNMLAARITALEGA